MTFPRFAISTARLCTSVSQLASNSIQGTMAPIKMVIRELSKRARVVMSHERIRYERIRCELEFAGQRGTVRRTTCPGCEEDLERDDNAARNIASVLPISRSDPIEDLPPYREGSTCALKFLCG